jgi:predicted glutamine amidotransferase
MLRNTQPFARELGGRTHFFAHNGMLPGIEDDGRFETRRFRRIGDPTRSRRSAHFWSV